MDTHMHKEATRRCTVRARVHSRGEEGRVERKKGREIREKGDGSEKEIIEMEVKKIRDS